MNNPINRKLTHKNIIKDINLLKSKSFLMGFEVEMLFDTTKTHNSDLRKKLLKIHPKIDMGSDGSINCNAHWILEGAEIRTPPLPPEESLKILSKVFTLINRYGTTNSTCGFHVNISPTSQKLYKSINPFKFSMDALWGKIKKDFGRTHNDYCNPVFGKNSPDLVEAFLYAARRGINTFKDADVNFEHYDGQKDLRRVEIRAFGGSGYHKKFKLIKKYCGQILNKFVLCCES